MIKNLKYTIAAAAMLLGLSASAQSWFTPEVEQRAEELLKHMTVKEKLQYIGGIDWLYTKEVPRLGIPKIRMSDGPQGVVEWGNSTAYPCALMLASTFNRDLAYDYGTSLARDSKARGVDILLGPAVNIHRAPMCGRNFEYMGEDPYLASQTSTGYIKGVQDNGVMAVIKHFTANFQDYDRNYISSDIDERTRHEIYFPAFKAAVQEAGTGAIMTSYNLLNGVWTTEDPTLLKDVLRDMWGFNGLVMSDWGSTHNCLPAATSGLDLEMATNQIQNEDDLRKLLDSGQITMADIDLKVKHILQTLIAFGFFDKAPWDGVNPTADFPESVETALEVSRDGVVLLKNNDNILPLSKEKYSKIAVVGNNALINAAGGGSGLVPAFRYTSYYDGLKKLGEEKGFTVVYVEQYDHLADALFTGPGSQTPGLKGEYFNNETLSGNPVATSTDTRIGYDWTQGSGIDGVSKDHFSVRWTGVIRPAESGEYTFRVTGDDGFRLIFDGKTVIDEYREGATRTNTHTASLTAGKEYPVTLEYFQAGGGAVIDFAWERKGDENRFAEMLNQSDLIVAFVGHNSSSEGEGSDRSADLPADARTLLSTVQAKTTKPLITIVNGGGNVYLWDLEPRMSALLWGWYGGQEAGQAMAEILLGEVNPSGKLPVTFEKRWEDNPVFKSYYDEDNDKHVKFTEGIFVGYRGYDKNKTDVMYPFGYGLSYTTFDVSGINARNTEDGDNLVEVTCNVKNTGNVAGAEVVQLYVGKAEASPVERPVRELKNYEKVYLEPGETKTVTMTLDKGAFSYFDVTEGVKNFVVDNGLYNIELGTSSRDIRQKTQITINYEDTGVKELTANPKKPGLIPTVVRAGEPVKIKSGVAGNVSVYTVAGQLVASLADTDVIHTIGFVPGMYCVTYCYGAAQHSDKFIVR